MFLFFIINILFILITIAFFGFSFSIIENTNNGLLYCTFGRVSLIITGFVGTVIHEFSHLLMCIVFRHNIVEFKLFKPISSEYDGVLGYVNHTYKKNNIFQMAGNFFIGIAPIFGGTLSIVILLRLLLPKSFDLVVHSVNIDLYVNLVNNQNWYEFLNLLLKNSVDLFQIFFLSSKLSLTFIVFLFLMYSITTHMALSKADFRNSLSGLGIFVVIILIISVLGVATNNLEVIVKGDLYIFLFMFLGLFLSLITLIITYILNFIVNIIF